jgi:hypothetical protein
MKSEGFDSGWARPTVPPVSVDVEHDDALAHVAMLGAALRRIRRLDIERLRTLN